MLRTFLAIDLPSDIRRSVAGLLPHIPAGRPVQPENLHITLAFLGEQPEPLLEDLHLSLEDLRAPGFPLHLAGTDMFGTDQPRILYVGVPTTDPLEELQRKVKRMARQSGIDLPRARFRPHVTLARFRRSLVPDDHLRLARFLTDRARFSAGPFDVQSVSLMRSTLHRDGARYDELARYPLLAASG